MLRLLTAFVTVAGFGQAAPQIQSFALSPKDLLAQGVKIEAVEYQGRGAARLIKDGTGDGFVFVKGLDF